jgi:hypothetical protein
LPLVPDLHVWVLMSVVCVCVCVCVCLDDTELMESIGALGTSSFDAGFNNLNMSASFHPNLTLNGSGRDREWSASLSRARGGSGSGSGGIKPCVDVSSYPHARQVLTVGEAVCQV